MLILILILILVSVAVSATTVTVTAGTATEGMALSAPPFNPDFVLVIRRGRSGRVS